MSDSRFSTWTISELVTRQSTDEPITSTERVAEIERRIQAANERLKLLSDVIATVLDSSPYPDSYESKVLQAALDATKGES